MKTKCILVLLLLALSGCENPFNRKPQISFTDHEGIVEYGTSIDVMDFIEQTNTTEIKASKLDTKTIGKQTITYTAKLDDHTKEFQYVINIVDTQSPVFKEKAEDILIIENGTFDINNYFKAEDIVDGLVDLFLKEPIDNQKIGITKYTVIAKDQHDNQTSIDFNLIVKSKDEVVAIDESTKPVEIEKPTSNNNPLLDNPKPSEAKPNTGNSKDPSSNNKPEAPSQPSKPNKPNNKEFLFANGYDIKTGLDACASFISPHTSYSRACVPIYNQDDIGIGYLAKFD